MSKLKTVKEVVNACTNGAKVEIHGDDIEQSLLDDFNSLKALSIKCDGGGNIDFHDIDGKIISCEEGDDDHTNMFRLITVDSVKGILIKWICGISYESEDNIYSGGLVVNMVNVDTPLLDELKDYENITVIYEDYETYHYYELDGKIYSCVECEDGDYFINLTGFKKLESIESEVKGLLKSA